MNCSFPYASHVSLPPRDKLIVINFTVLWDFFFKFPHLNPKKDWKKKNTWFTFLILVKCILKWWNMSCFSVKSLTCSNRWRLDPRCYRCDSGLNITSITDPAGKETYFRLSISVLSHRSKAYSQYVCSSTRECCKTNLLFLLCPSNYFILLFFIPVPKLWGRSCCTSMAWTASSGMLRQYSGCTHSLDRR